MIGQMLRELSLASGHGKIAILKKYNTPNVRNLLRFTYDTEKVYHIKPGPIEVFQCFDRTEPLHMDESTLLYSLAAKKISGNSAREAIARVACAHGPLIKLILARDLKCGVAATSINKAIPGLIPQFKVQLAKEVPLEKVKFPCYAQLKYDGVRITTTIKGNKVWFRTRNGKTVNLPKLAAAFEGMNNIMLDGELVIRGGTMADRTSVSGMVNSAMHGGRILEDKLEYALFDWMGIDEFEACHNDTIYSTRYAAVKAIVSALATPLITLADNTLVSSPREVEALAKQLYSDGMEGIILKHPTHKYTFKRSKDWVKIKETKTADLVVTHAIEGEGKCQGLIGALMCTGEVEGRQVTVAVGSGLSDMQRGTPFDHYDNHTIEVKYNSVIRDSKTGNWSLFLPRFVCIRHDK